MVPFKSMQFFLVAGAPWPFPRENGAKREWSYPAALPPMGSWLKQALNLLRGIRQRKAPFFSGMTVTDFFLGNYYRWE